MIECGCPERDIKTLRYKRGRIKLYNKGHWTIGKHWTLSTRGEKHHLWKGGIKDHTGYLMQLAHGHHRENKHGYVLQHILVFEEYFKCCILKWGIVHHINEIKNDNRQENLMGMMAGKHVSHHLKGRKKWYKVSNQFLKAKVTPAAASRGTP